MKPTPLTSPTPPTPTDAPPAPARPSFLALLRQHGALTGALLLLVAGGTAAYWNSFDGAFVYDDREAIRDNKHLRTLWPLSEAVSLPTWSQGGTLSRRPLLGLSFALNYALTGPGLWGYHAVNLVIHLVAGALLLGILRRTLCLPVFGDRWQKASLPMALATTLIWLLHPLQTASVTYIAQRAESLVGMFLLLTLYAAIRGFTSPAPRRWYALAAGACAAGMASKELMVVAPLLVLLYDGLFVCPSFRAAVRNRWPFYLALAATWIILAVLLLATRQDVAQGFSSDSQPRYLLTQPGVILYYLQLTVWPWPILADYGWPDATGALEILLPAAVVLALLGASIWGLWRRHWAAYPAIWFLLILAPSSSFVALFQNVQIQRMYLPLAGLAALAVGGAWALGRRWAKDRPGRFPDAAGLALAAVLAAPLGYLTQLRNRDYHDPMAFWQDNVDRRPGSHRAWTNLGYSLAEAKKYAQAIPYFQRALELAGDNADGRRNLGRASLQAGRVDEALAHYRAALRQKGDVAEGCIGLGDALVQKARREANRDLRQGLVQEAVENYRRATDAQPRLGRAWDGLGVAYAMQGQYGPSLEATERAMQCEGESPEGHYNMAQALLALGRPREAIEHYYRTLDLGTDRPDVHVGIAMALTAQRRLADASRQYEVALAARPDDPVLHYRLGVLLLELRRFPDAAEHLRRALPPSGESPEVHFHLGRALASQKLFDPAIAEFQTALKQKPDFADAHDHLGQLLLLRKGPAEALVHFQEVLRLRPQSPAAMNSVAWLLATRADLAGREKLAVELAQKACQITRDENPVFLDTLGAALAADGQFEQAAVKVELAIQVARQRNLQAMVKDLQARLALYKAHTRFREGPPAP